MARKEKQFHFIYKTTNQVNMKFYIGMHSTDNLNDGYFGSGTRLWYSIKKYGEENFKLEILEFYETRKLLKERERELINDDLLRDPLCLNLKFGGEGGLTGLSEELRQKIRDGASNFLKNKWKDPEFAKKCNKLSSERMKEHHKNGKIKYNTRLGKKQSEETKKRIGQINSIHQKGDKNSQYGTCWITKNNLNKKIKKIDITIFENDGWVKGRVSQFKKAKDLG